LIDQTRPALTAGQLMRSRYTAYVQHNSAYLLHTWHPATRPSSLSFDPQLSWLGLTVTDTHAGNATDSHGTVEFTARYVIDAKTAELHENSRFVKENGLWYYVDGTTPTAPTSRIDKPARNAPCPCGSGKKYKRCCGA